MFLITDADLIAGPILDCPAGASPFGAQVRALGGTVISVDPAYSVSPAEIITADGEHYIAAALPHLPFPDGYFHLALSSHLLFAGATALAGAIRLRELGVLPADAPTGSCRRLV